jgi:hypothetical protein
MYHSFIDDDGCTYGSVEVFYLTARQIEEIDPSWDYENPEGDLGLTPGWYWQACFPGCLPDGEMVGPFKSEEDALGDARYVS